MTENKQPKGQKRDSKKRQPTFPTKLLEKKRERRRSTGGKRGGNGSDFREKKKLSERKKKSGDREAFREFSASPSRKNAGAAGSKREKRKTVTNRKETRRKKWRPSKEKATKGASGRLERDKKPQGGGSEKKKRIKGMHMRNDLRNGGGGSKKEKNEKMHNIKGARPEGEIIRYGGVLGYRLTARNLAIQAQRQKKRKLCDLKRRGTPENNQTTPAHPTVSNIQQNGRREKVTRKKAEKLCL